MKRKLSVFSIIFAILLSVLIPADFYYAASVSLSVSTSSVSVGDTVTVTVSVPDNVSGDLTLSYPSDKLEFSSATATVGGGNGSIQISIGKYGLATTNSVSVTFKAKAEGSATVTATPGAFGDNDTVESVDMSAASTTITVASQSSNGGGNTDAGNSESDKSADNFLASIKLSNGTLSPSFYYTKTSYTATVGYNVTSVVVTATTSSAKATIESVTGDGTVALSVGENTINIVVKAENGTERTYTIVVTRQAEGETTTETESETESETPGDVTTDILQWQGETLTPATEIPEDVVPQDFTMSEMVVGGEVIPTLTFANGNLQVLYLENTNGAGSLYVYDVAQNCIYPFIKIEAENSYVMVLLPNVEVAPAPEGYQECTLSIEGKGVITAYQYVQTSQDSTTQEGTTEGDTTTDTTTTSWNSLFNFGPETFYAAEPVISDFYLIYCMNESGETGWYMYDSVEETFQRYLPSLHVNNGTAVGGVADTTLQAQNAQLLTQLKDAQNLQRIILCVAIFVVAVLIIVIINLILKRRMDEELEDDEYDDDYEEDDIEFMDDEEDFDEEVSEEISDEEILDEDDEVEIEFYEIPEVTVDEEVVEDDDDELEIEFYEIPEVTIDEEDVVEEDDEMEIEFYEIPEVTVDEAEEIAPAVTEEPVAKAETVEKTVSTEKKEENREEKVSELERLLASRTVEDDGDDLEFIELD